LANAGINVLEPGALDYVPENTFSDFARNVFPALLGRGRRWWATEWADATGRTSGRWRPTRKPSATHSRARCGCVFPGNGEETSGLTGAVGSIHRPSSTGGQCLERTSPSGEGPPLPETSRWGAAAGSSPGPSSSAASYSPGSRVGGRAHLEDCIVGPGYDVRPGEQIRGGAPVRGKSGRA
jgi:mannose-1-phosphate guanylyltransferase